MLSTLAIPLLAYLLGSVSGSLLLGRLRGIDVRQHGSGNAGGTNALRTLGWRLALGVVLIDVGKGALAAGLALWFAPVAQQHWLLPAAVLAAVAGHTWPVFHGFRGGKGAATLVGGLAVAWPLALAVLLPVWLLAIGIGGYVGLATMLAALSLVPLALVQGEGGPVGFALLAAGFILYTHRANLQRMREGRESRFERARVLARLFGRRRA